jgi:hypothetical protein
MASGEPATGIETKLIQSATPASSVANHAAVRAHRRL